MNKKRALTAAAVVGGLYYLFMRSARAVTLPPQADIAPALTPEPPVPLPPAPPSQGNPATPEFWAQEPPPGRETVGPTELVPSGVKYTFGPGESWSNVAERTYGDYRWWPFLWDTNRALYPSPDNIKPGDPEITIPPVSTLPKELQVAYFARAETHRGIWRAHRRSPQWGRSYPDLPPSVLTPTR